MNEEDFNRAVGVRIRTARRNAGLTQEQLAAGCDMSRGSIANIELGDQATPPYRLARIALLLNVTANDLLPSLSEVTAEHQARALGLDEDLVALIGRVSKAADAKKRDDDGAS